MMVVAVISVLFSIPIIYYTALFFYLGGSPKFNTYRRKLHKKKENDSDDYWKLDRLGTYGDFGWSNSSDWK